MGSGLYPLSGGRLETSESIMLILTPLLEGRGWLKDSLDLLFELSNEDRLRILTTLQGKPSKLTELSTEIKLPNQEVSRQLARLSTLDLCFRDGKGLYNLTPYAEHVLKLIPGFEFLSLRRSYFKAHTAGNLPTEFQLRIGELSSCAPISDVVTSLAEMQQMIGEAAEYIWSIVEQPNITNARLTEDAVRRGVENKIILPSNIIASEPYIHYLKGMSPDHPLRSAKSERRFLDILPFSLVMSEREAPWILFPTLDGKLDYYGFKAKGREALKWCGDVFKHYWEAASTVPPERLRYLH
jgi:predicted transcriptional regulator